MFLPRKFGNRYQCSKWAQKWMFHLVAMLVSNQNRTGFWRRVSPAWDRPVPGSSGQVQPPEVVEGGRGRSATPEDKHGEGSVVVDGRMWIAFRYLVTLVALTTARRPEGGKTRFEILYITKMLFHFSTAVEQFRFANQRNYNVVIWS